MEQNTTKQMRSELDLVNGKGYSFVIDTTVRKPRLRIFPFLFYKSIPIKRTLTIYPLTLAVLDLISERIIAMPSNVLQEYKTKDKIIELVSKSARPLSEIVAIAALGERSFRTAMHDGVPFREVDNKGIKALANQILHSISPKTLATLVNVITNQSDLPNFLISSALMQGANTMNTMTEE
ncbi:MAG: hypothetical protein HUJ96_02875 [Marinilabiliaceae bacterium]|nr:hypothetical protein [Marinilabiliaceae bacterium]